MESTRNKLLSEFDDILTDKFELHNFQTLREIDFLKKILWETTKYGLDWYTVRFDNHKLTFSIKQKMIFDYYADELIYGMNEKDKKRHYRINHPMAKRIIFNLKANLKVYPTEMEFKLPDQKVTALENLKGQKGIFALYSAKIGDLVTIYEEIPMLIGITDKNKIVSQEQLELMMTLPATDSHLNPDIWSFYDSSERRKAMNVKTEEEYFTESELEKINNLAEKTKADYISKAKVNMNKFIESERQKLQEFTNDKKLSLDLKLKRLEKKIKDKKSKVKKLIEWEQDNFGYFKKGANSKTTGINAPKEKRPNLFFPIYVDRNNNISLEAMKGYEEILPITENQEMSWRWSREKIEREKYNIIVSKVNGKIALYKKQRPEIGDLPSKKPKSLLYKPEYSSGNGISQIKKIFGEKSFVYAKPERLIKDFIYLSTNPGNLVLDSFLGSGTTAAVAHKMGRRWIGIELGDHAYTHCYKRLKAVVDGEQGGISKDVNWQGGGGFKFYELAPSLIQKSEFGNPIISKKYNDEMVARAVAKHKGYYYEPDKNMFWKQSKSEDKNFLFVTKNHITPEDLDYIHTLMQSDEHLLICSMSYEKECSDQFANITIQQIPRVLLGKCDFMKESYSLNLNEDNEIDKEELADE